ncbi:SEC14-like protein 4 [Artemia franciscana]|uniref:SEC14-like protein 4 n=1 Tax=Artemia franciscana TaxID=6661 RepID=UPI0032DB555A
MEDLRQLTDDQKDILKKFSKEVEDLKLPYRNQAYIVRWLIARDFDIDKAFDMLKAHTHWRQKFGADKLTDTWIPTSIARSHIPLGFLGEDIDKNPTWILMLGNMDIRGVLKSVPNKEMLNYCAWILERSMRIIERNSKKNKTQINRLNIFVDLANWKVADLTSWISLNFGKDLAQMYEANYPEILGKLVIFNTPALFSVLYNFVKPFLSELTVQKIRIIGSDKNQWQQEFETLEETQIPKKWGGALTDQDGNEYALKKLGMNMGKRVPPSKYISNQCPELINVQ